MQEFKTWRGYRDFEARTVKRHRYRRTDDDETFLEALIATMGDRVKTLRAGRILARAQHGCTWVPIFTVEDEYIDDEPRPLAESRMKPLKGEAVEGRANPKGIPFIYLATNKETAMAEIRPWIGEFITVALFKTLRDLKLVDLTRHYKDFVYHLEEPDGIARAQAVWSDIDRAFAKPVIRTESTAEYAPTHVIAETFRDHGLDGIAYGTRCREDGSNIVLFDPDAVELRSSQVFAVKTISHAFSQESNPCFPRKPKKK